MATNRKLTKKSSSGRGGAKAAKSASLRQAPAAVKRAKSGLAPSPRRAVKSVTKAKSTSKAKAVPKAQPSLKAVAKPKTIAKSAAKVQKSEAVAGKSKVVKVESRNGKPAAGALKTKSSSKPLAGGKKKVQAKENPTTNPRLLKKIRALQSEREATKNIAFRPRQIQPPGVGDPFWEKEPTSDRIGLFVRDPYWLHVAWEITRGAVERAHAALAQQWHSAKPVLRLIRLEDTRTGVATESIQAEIEIHGGVRNWYIPWTGEAATFRASIGYKSPQDRFHWIATSNLVKTPAGSSTDAMDDHWSHLAPEGEKIYALSGGHNTELESIEMKKMLEERLNRRLGAPELARLAIAADVPVRFRSDFFFDLDVELVFYGATEPHSFVTINEEPVILRPDGSFAVRVPFPERRNVMSAVAIARDGSNQRTVVVGIERNTKVMDLFDRENDSGD